MMVEQTLATLAVLALALAFVPVVQSVVRRWVRYRRVLAGLNPQGSGGPPPSLWEHYRAAFIVYALAIPYLAALFAWVDYVAPLHITRPLAEAMPSNSFISGALLALLIWLVLPAIPTKFSSGGGVNPNSYKELRTRHELLRDTLTNLQPAWVADTATGLAHAQATVAVEELGRALGQRGTQWLWGDGYIDSWRTLHGAEEELIRLLPCELACEGAILDHLRLNGSTLENRDELIRNLALAAVHLDPALAPVFNLPLSVGTPASNPPGGPAGQQLRTILKTVRRAINTFRDEQWAVLVNTRNFLYKIIMLLELSALLLLGLAISVGARREAIIAATAYFMVGVVLGRLFSRLSTALQDGDKVSEDYGLSTARMLATPLFTGLAAVGGVFLALVIPSVLDFTPMLTTSAAGTPIATMTATVAATTQPTSAPSVPSRQAVAIPLALRNAATPTATAEAACPPTAVAAPARQPVPTLAEIFDYNPIKFIVAAFFGLTPAYFFDRLGQANRQIMGIISTEPTNKARA